MKHYLRVVDIGNLNVPMGFNVTFIILILFSEISNTLQFSWSQTTKVLRIRCHLNIVLTVSQTIS